MKLKRQHKGQTVTWDLNDGPYHIGARCPAACGYVFSTGFMGLGLSSTPDSAAHHPMGSLTVCTRCGKTLVVNKERGPILLDETALMLLTTVQREALQTVRELLAIARRDVQ